MWRKYGGVNIAVCFSELRGLRTKAAGTVTNRSQSTSPLRDQRFGGTPFWPSKKRKKSLSGLSTMVAPPAPNAFR